MADKEVRLIDANALMERLNKKKAGPANARYTEGFNDAIMKFRSMIHGAPTIDPESLRPNGKWLQLEYDKAWTKCSECKCNWEWSIVKECNMNYCPNCGAKMDLEE